MQIYLIRHGQTDRNKKKLLQGRSDTELNDYGRELAVLAAKKLENVDFDCAFTSPLKRARETTQIVVGKRSIPIIEEKRIQEISFGIYEGMCYDREHFNIPDVDFMNFFDKPENYKKPPEGESFQEIIERTGEFLQELIENPEYADKTILISTHGCALKALLANIEKTSIEHFWGDGVPGNCAVTRISVANGIARIEEEGKSILM